MRMNIAGGWKCGKWNGCMSVGKENLGLENEKCLCDV